MERFLKRVRAFWGSAQAQDVAEYAVMLAVILLLVIGTVKVISGRRGGHALPAQAPKESQR